MTTENNDESIDLTIFVACYNEQENIVPTFEVIREAGRQLGCAYEVLVIDDRSTDNSVQVIRDYQQKHPDFPLRLHCNEKNRGLAYNFVEAAFLGKGKYFKLVCGDDAEPLNCMLPVLGARGKADLIIPRPIMIENKTLFRRMLSRTYTFIVNTLSGYSLGYWNGCAVYLRRDVMRWHSNTAGFGFQADLVSQLLMEGRTYMEISNTYRERRSGESKALHFQNLCSVAHTLLTIFLRRMRRILFEPAALKQSRRIEWKP